MNNIKALIEAVDEIPNSNEPLDKYVSGGYFLIKAGEAADAAAPEIKELVELTRKLVTGGTLTVAERERIRELVG